MTFNLGHCIRRRKILKPADVKVLEFNFELSGRISSATRQTKSEEINHNIKKKITV